MFRDQRAHDNCAIFHSLDLANQPLLLFSTFLTNFLAPRPAFWFHAQRLARAPKSTCHCASSLPFAPAANIPNFLSQLGASVLVTAFMPLRVIRKMKDDNCDKVGDASAVHEVDAHNVVSVWAASDKLEYSARTIRSKIRGASSVSDRIPRISASQ